jgi:hypothetical protein
MNLALQDLYYIVGIFSLSINISYTVYKFVKDKRHEKSNCPQPEKLNSY